MNKKAMAATVSMILAGGAHAAQQERPNVIVIIADVGPGALNAAHRQQ